MKPDELGHCPTYQERGAKHKSPGLHPIDTRSSTHVKAQPGIASLAGILAALSHTVALLESTCGSPKLKTCHRNQTLHLFLPWPLRDSSVQDSVNLKAYTSTIATKEFTNRCEDVS